jgi:hypothetical protein
MAYMDYKGNNMSTDRENGRGNKRARVTRGSRNPKWLARNKKVLSPSVFRLAVVEYLKVLRIFL